MAARVEEKKATFDFDENKANETMDRFSRTVAELGVETMKNYTAMTILVIGQKGVGIETAKNLVLGGPKGVTVWDPEVVAIADLGTNFYLREAHVGKVSRAHAGVGELAELNPYVTVEELKGELTEEVIAKFGAVVVTEQLPKELMYSVNKWARAHKAVYIMALTYGLTATFFSDFGDAHVITDQDGEPALNLVVESIDEFGVVTVTDDHKLEDGSYVKFSEVEGMEVLNGLERVRIRRVTAKIADMDAKTQTQRKDAKGNLRWRNTTLFNKFQIDLSESKELAAFFEGKEVAADAGSADGMQTFMRDRSGRLVLVQARTIGTYVKGGIVTEVKPRTTVKFLSLPDALVTPTEFNMPVPHMDQMRLLDGRGTQLHFAYMAINEWAARTGNGLPRLHNTADAAGVVAVAKDILANFKSKGEGKAITVETIDEDVVTKVALFARAELPGLCAFLGGVAAQEVVKKFGKYTPVRQFIYVDYFELLPLGTTVPADRTPLGTRYDHQIAIFGKAFQDKIGAANWFLVGSGALGCEYLKGIALMGVGSGPTGMIHVTDMDRIELSNLSRQFLFRQKHVGKPKSRCSSEVAKEMNPGLNITTYETKVCPETENLFDEKFWNSVHGVWNALDNIQARLYTDSQCVLHSLPLLESGTEGTKCNSSIHIPRVTPSYSEGHAKNQPEGNIPACTLKNFPHLIIHCIEWARPRFSDIFELGPRNVNTLLQDKAKLFKQIDAEKHVGAKLELLQSIKSLLDKSTNRTFDACIQLAFDEFTQQFRNRILDLTHFQPEHSRVTKTSETGEVLDLGPFWSGKQRFPSAASIDLSDELQFAFLYNTANLYAYMFGLPPMRDQAAFRAKAAEMKLAHPTWSPPKKAIDMSTDTSKKEEKKGEEKHDDEEAAATARLLEEFKNLDVTKFKPLNEADFEKDDDTNFHIDYITSCSNMRAWNYKIKPATRLKCKVIAGKIIAALATTTALVSGLIELEFYKIVMGLKKEKIVTGEGKDQKTTEVQPYFNSNVNLAVATFNLFEVSDPPRTVDSFDQTLQMDIKAVPSGWTKWDKIVIDQGDLTVGELIEVFPKIHHGCQLKSVTKHGLEEKDAGVFLFSTDDVYLGAAKKAAHQARLTQKVSDLYAAAYPLKEGLPPRKYLLLDAEATLDDAPVLVPVLKYTFAK